MHSERREGISWETSTNAVTLNASSCYTALLGTSGGGGGGGGGGRPAPPAPPPPPP
eukprot:COSAG05_NODE_3650_length_1931_cov_4.665939_1_plen_55_part_10